jgi:hypothetical protein
MSLPTKSINKAATGGRGGGKLSSARGRASGRGATRTRGGANKAGSGSLGSFYNHESSLLSGDISNSAKSLNKVQENTPDQNLIFGDCQKDLLNESRISEVSQIYKSEYNSNSSESLNLEGAGKKRSSRSASANTSERRNLFASDKKQDSQTSLNFGFSKMKLNQSLNITKISKNS